MSREIIFTVAVCLLCMPAHRSIAQALDRALMVNEAGLYVAIGKSAYVVEDVGLSIGNSSVWRPDVEIGWLQNSIAIGAAYRYYSSMYPISFKIGEIESRQLYNFEIFYKRFIHRVAQFNIDFGIGLAWQNMKETLIEDVVNHGGWHEIHSEVNESNQWGPVFMVYMNYVLSNTLFCNFQISYTTYLNSRDAVRFGIGLGYRIPL